MAKKGKKGKKASVEKGPDQVTTLKVFQDRESMLNPRIGDHHNRNLKLDVILEAKIQDIIYNSSTMQLKELGLSNLRLSSIPRLPEVKIYLFNIQEIDLSSNNLFDMVTLFEVLNQFENLKLLNLSNNYLNSELPSITCPLLEELILDRNNITSFSSEACLNLANIKILSLSDNNLNSFPESCSNWKKLERLNMRCNKFSQFPINTLESWTQLRYLYIGSNNMKALPEDIGCLVNLIEFDCSNNSISLIPTSIINCVQLKYLHLGNNKITSIQPEVFVALPEIKELQLFKNKLSSLPTEIGLLHNLEKLSIASNSIKKVPEELGNLENLQELYLSNNKKLSSIPSTAGHLRRLKELSLRNCPALKQLPVEIAENCSELIEIDVRAKKNKCKISPEMMEMLKNNNCVIRGGIVKKIKAKQKKTKKTK